MITHCIPYRTNYLYRCLIILFSAVLLTNCENSPTSPELDNPEIVTGTVILSDTLSGTLGIDNSPYIIRKRVTVPRDSTLIIKPGVKIYFKSSEEFEDFNYEELKIGMLEVFGNIVADGTKDSMITFSRANEKGHWGMIFIQSNNTNKESIFNYCTLEYGNKVDGILQIDDPNYGIIMTNYSKIIINKSRIQNSKTDGVGCRNSTLIFSNNTVTYNAGEGITCYKTDSDISNSLFDDNNKSEIFLKECYNSVIKDNVILGSVWTKSSNHGIVLWNSVSEIKGNSIMNCGAGILILQTGVFNYASPYSVNISENNITNNAVGMDIENDAKIIPDIFSNTITNNSGYGIILRSEPSSKVKIRENIIDNNGEGIYAEFTYYLTIYGNIIKNNTENGIYCTNCGDVNITNNEIIGNGIGSIYFGGIHLQHTDKTSYLVGNLIQNNNFGIRAQPWESVFIYNCTIVENKVGLKMKGSDKIMNSIIYGNGVSFDTSETYSPVEISYSLIQDSILAPELTDMGNNLLAVDPLFVDAANNDYRLSVGSPCIDMGTTAIDSLPEFDLLGNPRIVGSSIDIGAYEFQGVK